MALGPADFNLQGTDTFHLEDSLDDNIFIGHVPLRRFVSLKAFISNITIECTKDLETKEESNKNHTLITEYVGTFNYNVTINMPAATLQEARNNLAKVEELQKLISRYSTTKEGRYFRNISNKSGTSLPIFKVWFRNLISSGKAFKAYPSASTVDFESVDKHGLACFIDNIVYEPDMEMGFFEDDRFLFPKNIVLNLKLLYESEDDANREGILGVAMNGFRANGTFSNDDIGTAPFGVFAFDDGHDKAGLAGASSENLREWGDGIEFTTQTMNALSSSVEGYKEDTYLFISLVRTSENSPMRYVRFKGYIESHTRDFAVNITLSDSKQRNVGNSAKNTRQPISFKHLINKMKVNIPSANLKEAKQNCAKIQHLLRMFYKAHSSADSLGSRLEQLEQEKRTLEEKLRNSARESDRQSSASRLATAGKNLLKGRQDLNESVSRSVVVYSPSFIEAPNATYNIPSSFTGMYNSGIVMSMTNLSIDIDVEHGFFRDTYGRVFPKAMSVDIEFLYLKDDLVKNYKFQNEKTYLMMANPASSDYRGKEQFYPFNRKTVKIGG